MTQVQGTETEGTVAPETDAGEQKTGGQDQGNLAAEVAGMNKTVTEFQSGDRIPQCIQDLGLKSLDEVRAAVKRANEPVTDTRRDRGRDTDEGDKDTPQDGLRRDPVSGRPLRPRKSEHTDDIGNYDEDAHEDAKDAHEVAVRRWEKDEDDLQNAELAEAQAADSIFKGDGAKPVLDAFDGDVGKAKDCALVLAAGISGGEGPASPEHVAEGFRMLQKVLDTYLNAHAEEAMTRSREAANQEPGTVAPSVGAQSPSEAGEKKAPAVPGSDERTTQLSGVLKEHGVE